MNGELRTKGLMMLLSLVASVVLFLYVQSQTETPNANNLHTLDIEVRNLDPGFYARVQPSKATWQAVGPAEALLAIDREKLHAYVDVNGQPEGELKLEVKLEAPNYPNVEWRILRPTATVRLERIVTREVPVTIEVVGQLGQPNVVYSDATAEPKSVLVEGPRSAVESVKTVEALLDLSRAGESVGMEAAVLPIDTEGNRVANVKTDPERVMIFPALAAAPQSKTVFVNANYRGQPRFGYRVKRIEVNPPRVRVSGNSELVASFTVLETAPVDLEGLQETRTFSTRVVTPAGIRAAPEFVQVRVVVEPMPSPRPADPSTSDSGPLPENP
jgi:YbbR domain-containing protein